LLFSWGDSAKGQISRRNLYWDGVSCSCSVWHITSKKPILHISRDNWPDSQNKGGMMEFAVMEPPWLAVGHQLTKFLNIHQNPPLKRSTPWGTPPYIVLIVIY